MGFVWSPSAQHGGECAPGGVLDITSDRLGFWVCPSPPSSHDMPDSTASSLEGEETSAFAPTFIVLGAMKSGTTWIDDMLRTASSAVLPATTKETFFFDRYWTRGLAWYRAQFPAADSSTGPKFGEVASTYYASERARERICAVAPEAQLVVVLREPGGRSWSHYQHLIRKGELRPNEPFHLAVERRPEILGWSRYADLLQPWRESRSDRFHVLQYEHLRQDPSLFAERVGAAVGVEIDISAVQASARNSARAPRSHLAAKVAGRLSERLHGVGLHRLVTAAKALHLDRLVERPVDGEESEYDEEQLDGLDLVRSELHDDMNRCIATYSLDATLW